MSGAGPYAEGAPTEGATVLLDGGGPEGMLVFGIQLAGWRWPMRMEIDVLPETGEADVSFSCARGRCRALLAEIPHSEVAEKGWAFDPLVLADYAAGHLPTCRAGSAVPS